MNATVEVQRSSTIKLKVFDSYGKRGTYHATITTTTLRDSGSYRFMHHHWCKWCKWCSVSKILILYPFPGNPGMNSKDWWLHRTGSCQTSTSVEVCFTHSPVTGNTMKYQSVSDIYIFFFMMGHNHNKPVI
jgi:hypothetical protein